MREEREVSVKYLLTVSPHRLSSNPEEERFLAAWTRENDYATRTPLINYLLTGGATRPAPASDRDNLVAATVIQWLGSPVGQTFLRDLGYERSGRE